MLEAYRFLLALVVLQAHLSSLGWPWLAWQAVFGFYVLSGFLMTLTLNETYGFTGAGFARFCINRFLRLFPNYYVLLVVTVLVIASGIQLDQVNASLRLPTGAQWLPNLAIFGLVGFSGNQVASARLLPTSWSLSIELLCYVLLAAYFAKSVQRLLVLFGIGIIATIAGFDSSSPDYGFFDRYTTIEAGFIPFAIGGLAYHARMSFSSRRSIAIALFVAIAMNALMGAMSQFHQYVSGLYIAVVLNGALIPTLFNRRARPERWQATLGRMAYPLFISHWLVGALVLQLIDVAPLGPLHLSISLVATGCISFVLSMIDESVNTLRRRIKAHGDLPPSAVLRPTPAALPGK